MSRKPRNKPTRSTAASSRRRPPPRPSTLTYSPILDGRPSALDRPSVLNNRRGGRRPGAGAPPANLNAYRHGRYSRQKRQLVSLLVVLKAHLPTALIPVHTRLLEDAHTGQEIHRLRLDLDDLKSRAALQEDFDDPASAA